MFFIFLIWRNVRSQPLTSLSIVIYVFSSLLYIPKILILLTFSLNSLKTSSKFKFLGKIKSKKKKYSKGFSGIGLDSILLDLSYILQILLKHYKDCREYGVR